MGWTFRGGGPRAEPGDDAKAKRSYCRGQPKRLPDFGVLPGGEFVRELILDYLIIVCWAAIAVTIAVKLGVLP